MGGLSATRSANSGPQANMSLVPDPSAWFVSVSSPAPFDWFHFWGYALWTIGLLIQLAVVSFPFLDLVMHRCLFVQGYKKLLGVSGSFLVWLSAHPINLIPVLYVIFMMLCGYWLPKLAWCQCPVPPVNPVKPVDPVPCLSRHQCCALAQSLHCAIKPHHHFKQVCHWPPSLKQQVTILDYQHLLFKVNTILAYVHHWGGVLHVILLPSV